MSVKKKNKQKTKKTTIHWSELIHQKKFISEIFPNYCMTINDYLEESLSFTLVSSAILFSFSWDEATPVDRESSISYKDRLMLQHNYTISVESCNPLFISFAN